LRPATNAPFSPWASLMEAFESFVAVALEADGFVVSSALKFDVT
jgi:hypothetical protein